MSREIIEDEIQLNEDGTSITNLSKFLNKYGFETRFGLIDFSNGVSDSVETFRDQLPAILPVDTRGGQHFVVIKNFNGKTFEVLDPKEKYPLKKTHAELSQIAIYSSALLELVDVRDSLEMQLKELLKNYNKEFSRELTDKELVDSVNKALYFSHIKEKFGFKDDQSSFEFLEDLMLNQELKNIPKHFQESTALNEDKVRFKAPVILTVKKVEETHGKVIETGGNIYFKVFKIVYSLRAFWYIFILTSVIAAIIGYCAVFINQILIDYVLPSYHISTLQIFVLGVGAYYIVDKGFSIYKKYISIHLSNSFDRYFISNFDDKMTNFNIKYIQGFKRGDLTERLRDTMKLKSFFTRYFSSILVDLIIAVTSFVVLAAINFKLSLIVLVVMILFGIQFKIFTPIIQNLERERHISKAAFMSKFIEKIECLQPIKSLGLEYHSSRTIKNKMDELIEIQTKSKYVGILNSLIISITTTFSSLLILYLASSELINFQTISIGMILTFLALSSKVFGAFSGLLDKNLVLQENRVVLERFFSFNEKLLSTADSTEPITEEQKKIPPFESLSLSDVSFAYDDDNMILNNVNLVINKGDRIQILGKNGSGKSTLCKLLGLLYNPNNGRMTYNGNNLNTYNKRNLRKKVLYISNEDTLFNETFLFNVSPNKDCDMQLLEELCKQLGLTKLIKGKVNRYNFMIHENGRNLSTGQKKKVLILRAILSDAELIIFDEVLTGLDIKSRAAAVDVMNSMLDKTLVIISHMNISGLKLDNQYKLKNGKIKI